MEIPLSLKNQRILSQYPLSGQENMPVFHEDSYEPVFEQCNAPAPSGIYIMKAQVLPESRGKSFANQLALANGNITPLTVRTWSSAIRILNGLTCFDGRGELWTYARAPETLTIGGNKHHAISGGFARGSGLLVSSFDFDCVAVAPGGPAELLLLSLLNFKLQWGTDFIHPPIILPIS